MKTYRIATIPGDGIGKEVIPAGQQVMQALAQACGTFAFEFENFGWGGDYYRQHGVMMPADGLDALRNKDAILFGSAGDMTSATGEYFTLYYSKAEQATAQTAQMARVFESLGLGLPQSIAGFRALVEAQDLTTEAGRAAYVTLIQLAPAFAELIGAAQDAASAAAIADERLSLERQLLEVQGNTAALRALDLAQLDESNRALQQQIWALQDQQKAADEAAAAAEKLRSAWESITDSLLSEVARIRGSMGSGQKPTPRFCPSSTLPLLLPEPVIRRRPSHCRASAKAF